MMKFKMLYSLALLAGLCMVHSVQAQTYGPFNPPYGDSETYNVWFADRAAYDARPGTARWDGGALGTDLTGPYLPHDIVGSVTTDGLTWDIGPETNKFYNGLSHEGVDATNWWRSAPFDDTADGGEYHESLTFYGRTMVGTETNVILVYTVNSNTLDTDRYDIQSFIKVVDVSDGSAFIETNINLDAVTSGTYTQVMTVTDAETWAPAPLQAGFRLLGTNANPAYAASYGSFNVTINDLILIAPDPTAPDPDPMTFDVPPTAISDNKVTMTATTATDISGLEYEFQRLVGGVQVYTSSVPEIVIDDLTAATPYSFRVRAVDLSSSANATAWSGIFAVTTSVSDVTIPLPNPAEIAASDGSSQSVKLTATPATDASAVEYFFDCIAGDGVDSGWIADNVYVNTGLGSSSNFIWQVTVRDLSAATNTTTASSPILVATESFPGSVSVSNTLQSYTGTNNDNETVHEVLKDTYDFADYLPNDRRITFDGAGANFGLLNTDPNGDFGRNVMRTLANNYAAADFTSEITINGWTTNGHAFFGFGVGDIGAFGVPDWSPNQETTNASFIVQFDGVDMVIWSQTNNFGNLEGGDYTETFTIPCAWSTTNDTWRVKMEYNAGAGTATVSVDLTYDGVLFAPDVSSGPIATPALPQSKIYIAGDDGIVISDWDTTASGLPPLVVPADLVIVSSDGSTATLQWTGVAGQTYDVEFSTDLTGGFTLDGANENIPGVDGVMSTSSSAGGGDTFFQIGTDY